MKNFMVKLLKGIGKITYWIFTYLVIVCMMSGTLFLVSLFCAKFVGDEIIQYQENVLKDFDIENFKYSPSLTTQILSKDGTLLAELYDENRKYITFSQMPQDLINATVAVEDRRFYNHHGLDPTGVLRSLATNIQSNGISQGSSTITMQLTRNLFLSNEQTFERKIKEMIISLELEKTFDKNKILEMYLNEIFFGNRSYGIESASQGYFGKTISDLELDEITILVGLPKSPTAYNPYKDMDKAVNRRLAVLDSMYRENLITKEQVEEIKDKEVVLNSSEKNKLTIANARYPYFTNWIVSELESTLGNALYTSGYKIYTTIDDELQSLAEATVRELSPEYEKKFKAKDMAIVSVNPKTGELLSMVGGDNFEENQVNMAVKPRQTGSSMKPFVYATALDLGLYTDSSIVLDAPFKVGDYEPQNYNKSFSGNITVREALTKSNNIVALKVAQAVGTDKIHEYAKKMGISTLTSNDFGLSMALGGLYLGISPYEMASAYGTFANKGTYVTPHYISKIEDSHGNEILTTSVQKEQVLKEDTANQINSMLQDVVTRGTGVAAQIEGVKVAGKTGTTNNSKDIWFVGYTPEIVSSVWVGNGNGAETNQASGIGSTASKAWKQYMTKVYEIINPSDFEYNVDLVNKSLYITDDGKLYLPGKYCDVSGVGGNSPEHMRNYVVKSFSIRADQVPTETKDCEFNSSEDFVSSYLKESTSRKTRIQELVDMGYLQTLVGYGYTKDLVEAGFIDDLVKLGHTQKVIDAGFENMLKEKGYVDVEVNLENGEEVEVEVDPFSNVNVQPINPPTVINPADLEN